MGLAKALKMTRLLSNLIFPHTSVNLPQPRVPLLAQFHWVQATGEVTPPNFPNSHYLIMDRKMGRKGFKTVNQSFCILPWASVSERRREHPAACPRTGTQLPAHSRMINL